MKKYKCHKEVHAEPMTRGAYNAYRGWVTPSNEDPNDEGVLVVYNKDTEDHYESWSPKKQFNEGYSCIDSYKQRMQLEFEELKVKLLKLQQFMLSEKYSALDKRQANLFDSQKYSMEQYCSTLLRRIYVDPKDEDDEAMSSESR